MKKILTHPAAIIIIGYLVMLSFFLIITAFLSGKENWNNHISDIERKNLSTDAEISCIMYKHGFANMDLMDDPSPLDFIKSGFENVPMYCSTCIDVQH